MRSNQATSDGIYQLTPEQQQDYQHALDAMDALSAQRAMAPTGQVAPGPVDPLDPARQVRCLHARSV